MTRSIHLPALACLSIAACSPAPEPEPAAAPLPATIEIGEPTRKVERMELVEDLSEEVADRLLDLSDKLRRRDFRAAEGWFSPTFAGTESTGSRRR